MKVKIKCDGNGGFALPGDVVIEDEGGNDLTALTMITGITIYINPQGIVEAEIEEFNLDTGTIEKNKREASLDLDGVLANVSLDLVEKLAAAHGYQLMRMTERPRVPFVFEEDDDEPAPETAEYDGSQYVSMYWGINADRRIGVLGECEKENAEREAEFKRKIDAAREKHVDLLDDFTGFDIFFGTGDSATYPATLYSPAEPEAADPDKAKRDAIAKATKAICGG